MLLVLEWVLSPSAELIVDFALIIFAESKYGYFTDNKTSIKRVEWIKKPNENEIKTIVKPGLYWSWFQGHAQRRKAMNA